MNNINKSVICIVLVIIFIAVFIGLRNSFAEKTNTVEIIQDGKTGGKIRRKYGLYFLQNSRRGNPLK